MGSHYSTGPYINFFHFGNSNLGKLPHVIGFKAQGLGLTSSACMTIEKPSVMTPAAVKPAEELDLRPVEEKTSTSVPREPNIAKL